MLINYTKFPRWHFMIYLWLKAVKKSTSLFILLHTETVQEFEYCLFCKRHLRIPTHASQSSLDRVGKYIFIKEHRFTKLQRLTLLNRIIGVGHFRAYSGIWYYTRGLTIWTRSLPCCSTLQKHYRALILVVPNNRTFFALVCQRREMPLFGNTNMTVVTS